MCTYICIYIEREIYTFRGGGGPPAPPWANAPWGPGDGEWGGWIGVGIHQDIIQSPNMQTVQSSR